MMMMMMTWRVTLVPLLVLVTQNVVTATSATSWEKEYYDSGDDGRDDSFYIPNLHGCLHGKARALPYCNTSLSRQERLNDLMSHLGTSVPRLLAQITPQDTGIFGVDTCTTVSAGDDAIGFPPWLWLVEVNTQVASACLQPNHCATTFVNPTALGATFNKTAWWLKGVVLGVEMRALNNLHASRFHNPRPAIDPVVYAPIALTGFGPNINIVRDPRFGRNSELVSEDPLLTGTYAAEVVAGMQQRDAAGYPAMATFLKHFAAYSTETNREHAVYNISRYDLVDTYLAQFQLAVTRAKPAGVMCAYNGLHGYPSCANDWLLNQVLRKQWRHVHAVVTADCGAVHNLQGPPVNAANAMHAAAYALMNGTDLEMGSTTFATLHQAVTRGLVTTERIQQAVRRTLRLFLELGRFDPPLQISWTRLGLESVNSTKHQQINYETALQSLVLLDNQHDALPLAVGSRVAVLGPQATAKAGLLSDYAGDQQCYNGTIDCIISIAEAMERVNVDGITSVAKGVEMYNTTQTDGMATALELAQAADVVVLVLGNDRQMEREGLDRNDTSLQGLQEVFAHKVLALNKPTVLVLVNGGALAIDNLVTGPHRNQPYAIVEAFNPNVIGAKAIAASLFGLENRWGRLPITMYPHDYIGQQPMTNYDMATWPGRTYKYYQGTPLFRFGHGLSLTTFTFSCTLYLDNKLIQSDSHRNNVGLPSKIVCDVRNTGNVKGDMVLQLYHRATGIRKVNHPLPQRSLVDFARLSDIAPNGAKASTNFELSKDSFRVANERGSKVLYSGIHQLIVRTGNFEEEQVFPVSISPNPEGER